MLGSNTEKVLKVIDKLMVASASLSISPVEYAIKVELINGDIASTSAPADGGDGDGSGSGVHTHGAGSYTVSNWVSVEIPQVHTIANVSKLQPIKAEFDAIIGKTKIIDKNIYVKNTEMHNCIGSPYTELYRLQEALNDVISFTRSPGLMGEHVAACVEAGRLLNRAIFLIVDAKWAVIHYGDYYERGWNFIQGQNQDTYV